MSSLISCPGCKHKLALPDELGGQRVQCPQCAAEFDALATIIPMELEAPLAHSAAEPANEAPIPTAQPAPPLQTGYAPAGKAPARAPSAGACPPVYCIRCGTKGAQGQQACTACGHPHQALLDQPRHEPWRRPRRLTPIRGLLAVFGAILVPIGAVFLIGGLAGDEILRRSPPPVRFWIPFLSFCTGLLIEGTALALCLTWLFQAWRIVLRGDEDYSPGLMVGLLFVPFFNFYWMFRAIPGMSIALHDELKQLAPTREHGSGWVPGLAACILALVPFPPLWAISVCMFLAWMLIANNAVHRLIRLHETLRADTEQADTPDS